MRFTASFKKFLDKSRKVRELSIRHGVYPIAEEEALILYTISLEKAVTMHGVNVVEVGSDADTPACGSSRQL